MCRPLTINGEKYTPDGKSIEEILKERGLTKERVAVEIGDHEAKYTHTEEEGTGDEQFEIADARSFDDMYGDLEGEGMQPVTNDYVYVG